MKKIIILTILLLFFCINNLTFWDNIHNVKLDSTYNLIYTKLENKSNWNKSKLLVYLKLLDKKLQNYKTEDFKYLKTLNSNKIVWLTNSSNNDKLLNVTYNDNSITLYSKSICSSNYKNEHIEIFNWNSKVYATKNFSYDSKWCSLTIPNKNIIEWKIWKLSNENYIFWDLYSKLYEKKKFSDFNIKIDNSINKWMQLNAKIISNWNLNFYNDYDTSIGCKKLEYNDNERHYIYPLEYIMGKNSKNKIYWIIDDVENSSFLVLCWIIQKNDYTVNINNFIINNTFQQQILNWKNLDYSIILSYNDTVFIENKIEKNITPQLTQFIIPWLVWYNKDKFDLKFYIDEKEINLDTTANFSVDGLSPQYILPYSIEDLEKYEWKNIKLVIYDKKWNIIWTTTFSYWNINKENFATYLSIQKIANNLTKDIPNKEWKIKAIINWIVDNVTYSTQWSDKRWYMAYNNKYWSCFSYSSLANIMLYSIWIDSEFVSNSKNWIAHAIIRIDLDWEKYYIEPQNYYTKETEESLNKKWYKNLKPMSGYYRIIEWLLISDNPIIR